MRFLGFLTTLFWLCALPAWAERVTVFAASSLTSVLHEIAEDFETKTGHEVTLSVAGSATLARQILSGAPADIFLSANPDWMDAIAAEIVPGTRDDLLGNRLVMIAPAGAPDSRCAWCPASGRTAGHGAGRCGSSGDIWQGRVDASEPLGAPRRAGRPNR